MSAAARRWWEVVVVVLVTLWGGACDSQEQELFVPFDLPPELADLDLSYLPFEYLRDGCMYRSSYVGMELAVSGRPALAVQAQDCDFKTSIHGPAGERWRHHVAPAFVEDGEILVVDPTFSDQLLSPQEWRDGLGSDNLTLSYRSAAYSTGTPPEGHCPPEGPKDEVPSSVAQMTPFDPENLGIWCSYLRRYLRDGGQDPDGTREAALLARTAWLYDQLLDLGLISSMGQPPPRGSFGCPEAMVLP